MIKVIPAVLPRSFEELEQGLEKLKGIAPEVQVDLVGINVLTGRAMPLWDEFEFEIDVMLPAPVLDDLLALGASRMVIHAQYEYAKDALGQLQSLRDGNYPTAIGVALLPTTNPEALDEFAGLYDFIQVMGIDHVGAQGQPFDPNAIELVTRLHALHPLVPIQVDGHAAGHERELVAAGAERLIVGSAIIAAPNPELAYKQIYTRANGGS